MYIRVAFHVQCRPFICLRPRHNSHVCSDRATVCQCVSDIKQRNLGHGEAVIPMTCRTAVSKASLDLRSAEYRVQECRAYGHGQDLGLKV